MVYLFKCQVEFVAAVVGKVELVRYSLARG